MYLSFLNVICFNSAVTSIADVRHISIAITVAFNDIITFSDLKLNDGIRDVHYNKFITNTWEFSIFILSWVG